MSADGSDSDSCRIIFEEPLICRMQSKFNRLTWNPRHGLTHVQPASRLQQKFSPKNSGAAEAGRFAQVEAGMSVSAGTRVGGGGGTGCSELDGLRCVGV